MPISARGYRLEAHRHGNAAKGYKTGSFPALTGGSDVNYTRVKQEGMFTYEAVYFEDRGRIRVARRLEERAAARG